jgi:hypothetical protein
MKRIIRIAIGLLLFVWGIGTFQAEATQFELQIRLSKEAYLKAEPIWLDATLTNISEDTARTWGLCVPCLLDFEVIVKDEKGAVVKYTGLEYEVEKGSGYLMKPGDTYYGSIELSELFGDPPQPRAPMTNLTFTKSLKPGTYIVTAQYHVGPNTLNSNEIRFEVKPPTGKDKKAYQLLQDAYLFFIQKKLHSMTEKLHELLTTYPKSVYAEKACKHLVLDQLLIQKFPDSGYTQSALQAIADEKNKQEKKEFLQKIIQDYPGTRSAKFAEQMLRRG